ncbi:MAG: Tyrosine--tRNA ligase [Chlamydiia bacterium]|nr:Tyrosine--tRNA ligase [Chlamydiia bacterium]
MDIVSYLESRGLVEEISSNELREFLKTPRSLYIGIDPTASSIHLGNLVGLIVLRMCQNFGHRPVVVMGGATAMIGDPSGKSVERPLLSQEEIDQNIASISKTVESCLDYSNEKTKPIILNNTDWYNSMSMIDYLRDVGKGFRVGPMLGKESVRTRLNSEQGMSYTEFSYQLLQGYDFYHLNKVHNVELQIGGSDQYGNITAGIDYTRKTASKRVFGLAFPLLTRSDGKKFGKSEEGAIWLSRDMLSPFNFYQHILRFPDADMISMIKRLTFLSLETIKDLEKRQVAGDVKSFELQKILAEILTEFVHGKAGLEEAKSATNAMAIGSGEVNKEALKAALPSLPKISLSKNDVVGSSYLELLCKSGLLSSKGEARKLIKNNGAYLNRIRVEDIALKVTEDDLLDGHFLLLSSGKKKSLVVQVD